MAEPQVFAGAEPFLVENGNIGVLVSHGFTGNPHSMRYLAEGLASAGFTVALPRLKGHGTTPADMAASTASDWVADLERASAWLQQRCDTLFMTGLSMGGTLTLLMAGQHPDLFKGIIPINAMLFSNNPDLASLAFMSPAPAEMQGVGDDITLGLRPGQLALPLSLPRVTITSCHRPTPNIYSRSYPTRTNSWSGSKIPIMWQHWTTTKTSFFRRASTSSKLIRNRRPDKNVFLNIAFVSIEGVDEINPIARRQQAQSC